MFLETLQCFWNHSNVFVNSPMFLEIVQCFWNHSNVFGNSPMCLQNANSPMYFQIVQCVCVPLFVRFFFSKQLTNARQCCCSLCWPVRLSDNELKPLFLSFDRLDPQRQHPSLFISFHLFSSSKTYFFSSNQETKERV